MQVPGSENDRSERRWPIVAAGLAMQASLGALLTKQVFLVSAGKLQGETGAAVSVPFWYSLLFFLVGVVAASVLLSWLSARTLTIAGGTLLGMGFCLAAAASGSFVALWIGCGLLGGLGAGLAYMGPVSLLAARFPRRPGLAATLSVAAFGFGSIAIPPVIAGAAGFAPAAHVLGVSPVLALLGIGWFALLAGGARLLPAAGSTLAEEPLQIEQASRPALIAVRTWFAWSAFFVGTSVALIALRDGAPQLQLPSAVPAWLPAGFVAAGMLLGNTLGLAMWRWMVRWRGRGLAVSLFGLASTGLAVATAAESASIVHLAAVAGILGLTGGGLLAAMPTLRGQMLRSENLAGSFALMVPAYGLSAEFPRIWQQLPSASPTNDVGMLTLAAALLLGFLYLLFRPHRDYPADAA